MAIDSAEKRRSAYYAFHVRGIPAVTPNAAKDAEWRAEVFWTYSGIAIAAPPTAIPVKGFAGLIVSPGRMMSRMI